ncbi:MAG: trypsin-like peptidase domain-containing protein, partial [Muribaculaceae bacterium]|nr:trypsin-like peptidase domain-containing protein [Muribaculaceae bacterium]
PNDPFVGIYEGFGGNRYKLACLKDDEGYALLYISDKEKLPWWKIGDIKAILKMSATPGFFKADWIMTNKTYNDNVYVIFDKGTMKTVIDSDEEGYLKMYSSSSSANSNSEAKEQLEKWSGTGFALSNNFIATNYHVVENAKSISVKGINGEFIVSYNAEVVATDKFNDLALIRINDSRFNGFGDIPYSVKTNIAEVGEDIFVLGYPMTATMGDEIKLTTGVISAKTGYQGDVSLYQISAPIQPGNSGGPLFDNNANIIGVVNAKHQGAENVGYAIKASYLRNLIESYTSQSLLPADNVISTLPLTGKVQQAKNFVFMITCTNQ